MAARVLLVTGAASGIGRAAALAFVADGATVHAVDRNWDALRELSVIDGGAASADQGAPGPGALVPHPLDVTREADWERVSAAIRERHGGLDALVHAAGVSAGAPLVDTELSEWRRVLAVNLDGAFLATRTALRLIGPGGGAIVHIASASGIRPAPGAAAYSVSKAGLIMLVRTAARECHRAGRPIRVNAIAPAGVKTPMWGSMPFFQELVTTLGSEDAAYAALCSEPGERFAEPAEIVAALRFLLSDAARAITGTVLSVDGGYTLHDAV